MTDRELWSLFVQRENIKETEYEVWAFGGKPDKLAELVIAGIKTATASAYPLYKFENEPLPKEGGYSVILNSNAEAVCVIKTTKVYVVPFSQVTQEHARKEGEGNKSLEYWQKVHRIFSRTAWKTQICLLTKTCRWFVKSSNVFMLHKFHFAEHVTRTMSKSEPASKLSK